jgi:hypothetical protein
LSGIPRTVESQGIHSGDVKFFGFVMVRQKAWLWWLWNKFEVGLRLLRAPHATSHPHH